MIPVPDAYLDLLSDDKRAFAFLATMMPDGSPQITPIWFNTDDKFILINSVEGRTKDKNIRLQPRVALLIVDPVNPYRYLQIRGQVVEITPEGAIEHTHRLAMKYLGEPKNPSYAPDQVRVIYKIRPVKASGSG